MRKSGIRLLMIGLLLGLAGCAGYSTPRYGDDGVYGSRDSFDYFDYSRAPDYRPYSAWYPYWSLDHFYFSRYYSPYSVVIHPWDPWLYPYSAWYWNYPYSHAGFFAVGPWHYWGPWSYRYHRPWHRWSYEHRVAYDLNYRERRLGGGTGAQRARSQHELYRLERLEERRSRSGYDANVMRQRPISRQPTRTRTPTNRRAPIPTTRPVRRAPSRTERVREQPPRM